MLGANKVEKLEHLECLKRLHQILQLDLINNPVSRLPGYRENVYGMFKTLLVLDTLDKAGKDAYSNVLALLKQPLFPTCSLISSLQYVLE